MGADFSGYATKAGLVCSDGLTIMPDAFKHQDKVTVPLVWQHGHTDVDNVLGHAVLENRPDGVYAYGYLNDTPKGQTAKKMLQHGDITALSIYANNLVKKASQVFHGAIREVSLVLAGANPGAKIDFVSLEHSDGSYSELEDEAVIWSGEPLQHEEAKGEAEVKSTESETEDDVEHAETDTVEEIYTNMTPEQKAVVHYMLGVALEEAKSGDTAEQSATNTDEGDLTHKEGNDDMTRNVFEQNEASDKGNQHVLSHSDLKGIVESAQKGGSLKHAFEEYAIAHGIENLDVLFPDAKLANNTPEFDKRRTEWVSAVLNGTKHSPFSRVKTVVADITADEARAKGYIKGNLKKEEFFGLTKRVTTPTTVYKKQKLDRDDIIDITDLDVVAWMKGEMRLMLDEELARAILIGDGREVDDEDKIKDPAGVASGDGIRSIANDHDLYAATVEVANDASSMDTVDAILSAMQFYKGTGQPTFFTTLPVLTKLLLQRDTLNRRLWRNAQELASEMGVSSIVTVEVMEDEPDILGILVNLADYTIGSDRGGDVTMFDDFDIDYNQYKYLIETRLSGGLTKIRSAVVVRKAAAGATQVTPAAPTEDNNVVTIPTVTGVTYTNADTGAALTGTVTLTEGQTLNVQANPASGYYFSNNVDDEWSYTYQA